MLLYGLAALLSLGRTVLSAPPPVTGQTAREPWEYEAVIVGGGPSGLSAASGLARVRRNILVLDSGEYRNQATRHMHDVLGFDGVEPAYYRYQGRQQILEYSTVTMRNGTVTKIQTIKTPDYTYFCVVYTSPAGETVNTTAGKIVLGTGLRDKLPSTPGFSENWGKGIYWCPWCDGHEHADQELGIIGPFDQAASTVLEILTLNKNVIAFVNGTDTPAEQELTTQKTPIWQSILSENKVRVENRTMKSIVRLRNGTDGYHDPGKASTAELDKFRVDFEDGPSVTRDAFLVNIPNELASSVGPDMGVSLLGGRLQADNSKGLMTNVPGVFAVGDANSDNSTNVPHALYSGKRAAVFLHIQLEREAADRKAKAGKPNKRSVLDVRSVWEEMNGQEGSLLHAGELKE
ncbi:hypothetical protein CDD80_7427 [Ophiocordyceps camponoti-rufipedis]|uniref:FAD/NAD(P)-binding domain-containing protein n=1 Tax=Ophiocordyceps camponoti-rufipedis TaxID=2004952 RepID=A0A2C5XDL8_9HYPO|nr:hypothetical protein CDD80_7427 [Ophiocordyceps camponoti-rufipedis]